MVVVVLHSLTVPGEAQSLQYTNSKTPHSCHGPITVIFTVLRLRPPNYKTGPVTVTISLICPFLSASKSAVFVPVILASLHPEVLFFQ